MFFSSCFPKSIPKLNDKLCRAVIERNNDVVLSLLEQGARIDIDLSSIIGYYNGQDYQPAPAWGKLPLVHAAAIIPGNNKVLLTLFAKGADAKQVYEAPAYEGSGSILHNALTVHSDTDIINTLLAAGLDINQRNSKGMTPIQSYLNGRSYNPGFITILISKGAVLTDKDVSIILRRSVGGSGDYELLRACHTKRINLIPIDGGTILHHIAKGDASHKLEEIVQDFGLTREDYNKPDNNGRTPLSFAADNIPRGRNVSDKSTVLLRSLLEQRVVIDSADKDGKTPLMYAIASCNLSAVQLLVQGGADLHAVTKDGRTIADFLLESYKFCNEEVTVEISEYLNLSLSLQSSQAVRLTLT